MRNRLGIRNIGRWEGRKERTSLSSASGKKQRVGQRRAFEKKEEGHDYEESEGSQLRGLDSAPIIRPPYRGAGKRKFAEGPTVTFFNEKPTGSTRGDRVERILRVKGMGGDSLG